MFKNSKILLALISLGLLFTVISPQKAYAEQITDYKVEIKVNPDSKINIKETILYDFGTEEHHGIYREIPFLITNNEGKKYKFDIEVDGVQYGDRGNNNDVSYTQSVSDDNLVLKIGDANKTLTGQHTYIINYNVDGAFTYFSDHDELYWNAIGNGWTIPILKSNVKIDLSNLNGLTNTNVKLTCFTGVKGSIAKACNPQVTVPTAVVNINTFLEAYNGVTFALWLPKNTVEVHEPTPYTITDEIPTKLLWTFGLTIFSAIAAFIYWFIFGRDPSNNDVLVRMYDPPKGPDQKDLTPMEVSVIVTEKVEQSAISAEIINLAIKKYIKIVEDETKTLGIFKNKKMSLLQGPKLKEDLSMSQLKSHERDIITALGLDKAEPISIGDRDPVLAKEFEKIKKSVVENLTAQGYFDGNPDKVRSKWSILSTVLIFGGIWSTFYYICGPGVVLLILSLVLPRKTKLGVEAKRHALGLKQFLVSQDRQFEFQEKNYDLFEKLLPYAISFGVAKIWAKRFADIDNYKPDWYSSNSFTTFNTINIANSISTTFNSSVGTSSGFSSSGGSSGGGGGGGGGGSW